MATFFFDGDVCKVEMNHGDETGSFHSSSSNRLYHHAHEGLAPSLNDKKEIRTLPSHRIGGHGLSLGSMPLLSQGPRGPPPPYNIEAWEAVSSFIMRNEQNAGVLVPVPLGLLYPGWSVWGDQPNIQIPTDKRRRWRQIDLGEIHGNEVQYSLQSRDTSNLVHNAIRNAPDPPSAIDISVMSSLASAYQILSGNFHAHVIVQALLRWAPYSIAMELATWLLVPDEIDRLIQKEQGTRVLQALIERFSTSESLMHILLDYIVSNLDSLLSQETRNRWFTFTVNKFYSENVADKSRLTNAIIDGAQSWIDAGGSFAFTLSLALDNAPERIDEIYELDGLDQLLEQSSYETLLNVVIRICPSKVETFYRSRGEIPKRIVKAVALQCPDRGSILSCSD